ncbi:MAG: methyltransferase domain-containing protein [Acidimicrobiales bacterium]|nr:methyltransferase domain-containing protein [Acidimicrobiales bacterium]
MGKRVLLIGVEYGREVDGMWGPHQPGSVIGIDIGDYEHRWVEPSDRVIPIQFSKMDAAALGFRRESFDLIYSQGVLPHIVDVRAFLDDAHRVLRRGGVFYAFCCPLWHTYGGSHVWDLGYDHLIDDPGLFLERATGVGDGSHWWLEQGLFNKLRFAELYALVAERFELLSVGVIGTPDGRRVKRDEAATWCSLRGRYSEEDLMIRLVSFTARKRAT